ncbi:hypothetical protein [Propioniciclava soli]|uniref:hypothetical protein n=1 Tax=Propioniciclava soli TaxID=2775081 RepID=UPI001E2EFC22|nr:hypothetical protein [Propioniciclava soli]
MENDTRRIADARPDLVGKAPGRGGTSFRGPLIAIGIILVLSVADTAFRLATGGYVGVLTWATLITIVGALVFVARRGAQSQS